MFDSFRIGEMPSLAASLLAGDGKCPHCQEPLNARATINGAVLECEHCERVQFRLADAVGLTGHTLRRVGEAFC